MAPQVSEIWDQGDDWSGIASSKERRRRQNRLHQRAYRKYWHPAAARRSEPSALTISIESRVQEAPGEVPPSPAWDGRGFVDSCQSDYSHRH